VILAIRLLRRLKKPSRNDDKRTKTVFFTTVFMNAAQIYLSLFPMSLPLTNHTLEKLEALLLAMGYKVRYEKGNFKTGSCLLEHNKVVVVNKFSNLEGKIAALVTLVKQTNAGENLLDEKHRQFYQSLQQTELF
jgi:hypothetical protein